MIPELAIKLDYLKDRKNPSEVFEAMAQYIDAYSDFGQLLTNSVGLKSDFEFQLNGIESGSIISKLSSIPDRIENAIESALYSSGNSLFKELVDVEETSSEEDVEELAKVLEKNISKGISNKIVEPHVDRQSLSHVLAKFSSANENLTEKETVSFIPDDKKDQACQINTKWRFKGNPNEMFKGELKAVDVKDKLQVKISVNEGVSVWTFRSLAMKMTFSARITHTEWLKRYQNGLIQPIGPKDVLSVELSYDIFTPSNPSIPVSIRNAKITKIIEVDRFDGYQHEL